MISFGQEGLISNPSKIILPPENPALWTQWRAALSQIRSDTKKTVHYSDSLYSKKEFRWASACYNIGMLMLFDKSFYNLSTHTYTPEKFIAEGVKEFGGYDGVVLWHAYPRIGFDDRNQFDFYRDLPGGLKALRDVVEIFHRRGIRVFIDYNPWDKATKRERKTDMEMLAEIIKAINGDGIFLDTMNESSEEFRKKINEGKGGIVLESELELPVTDIYNHHMSWAQWYDDGKVPGILWNKWFERRHMLHMVRRWDKDHSSELQTAWMNGSGMIVWENIFGTSNSWNERDKSILRSMVGIQRHYHSIFSGEGWEPLYPSLLPDIFINEWHDQTSRLWTIVNRSEVATEGFTFTAKYSPGTKYFDLISGKETGVRRHDSIYVYNKIDARGIGAIIAISSGMVTQSFNQFLRQQAAIALRYKGLTHTTSEIETTVKAPLVSLSSKTIPPSMVNIKAATFETNIRFRERECGFYEIADKIGAGKKEDDNIVQRVKVSLMHYAIDETPVTYHQFYQFMQATAYKPADSGYFLMDWINGKPPPGKEDFPVVYVDLNDARAYARWSGKRLPTEAEWQYAAEGPLHTLYPWGNNFEKDNCNNGQFTGATPVRQFEKGKSAFGCYDMCGNTWEWTESERSDRHTRFAILKGGSYYKAGGSVWYADGGAKSNDFSAKFILLSAGLNRCSTIGFRCAATIVE